MSSKGLELERLKAMLGEARRAGKASTSASFVGGEGDLSRIAQGVQEIKAKLHHMREFEGADFDRESLRPRALFRGERNSLGPSFDAMLQDLSPEKVASVPLSEARLLEIRSFAKGEVASLEKRVKRA